MAKEMRGFASMSAEKRRRIASMGGRAAHQKRVAHEWTREQAREAGRKGGLARRILDELPRQSQPNPSMPTR
jgi:uncharacterized protein